MDWFRWRLLLLAIPLGVAALLFWEGNVEEGAPPQTGVAKRVAAMSARQKIGVVLAVGSGPGRYASSVLTVAAGRNGADINLFPDADVATPGSALAGQTFGGDPALVAQMTAAALSDCKRRGIACAPEHFPGLGAASQDTNAGPATVGTPRAELAQRDLRPFEAAIAAGSPAILVSHAFYAAYDPVTPASLSPAVIGGLLRRQLGFQGIVIDDDLSAGAIGAAGGAEAAAPRALAAGADLLLVEQPDDAAAARQGIEAALKSGALTAARLDSAATRLLEFKKGLHPKRPQGEQHHRRRAHRRP